MNMNTNILKPDNLNLNIKDNFEKLNIYVNEKLKEVLPNYKINIHLVNDDILKINDGDLYKKLIIDIDFEGTTEDVKLDIEGLIKILEYQIDCGYSGFTVYTRFNEIHKDRLKLFIYCLNGFTYENNFIDFIINETNNYEDGYIEYAISNQFIAEIIILNDVIKKIKNNLIFGIKNFIIESFDVEISDDKYDEKINDLLMDYISINEEN